MAKQKKRNKKKTSATNRKSRQVYSVINDTFNRLWFSGSSVTVGVETHNLRRISALLEPKDAMIAEGLLLDKLRSDEATWYFWIGVFCDDGDEVWCEPVAGDSAECTVRDFDKIITPMIEAAINTVNSPHAKGYGWVATPTYACDLVATEDNFIDMFMKQDITNEEKRLAVLAQAKKNTTIEESAINPRNKLLLDRAEHITNHLTSTNEHINDIDMLAVLKDARSEDSNTYRLDSVIASDISKIA